MVLGDCVFGVVAASVCMVPGAVSEGGGEFDYGCYLGSYAWEATPYWPAYRVIKEGEGLILQSGNSDYRRPLEQTDGALVLSEDGVERVRLFLEPGRQRCLVTIIVPEASGGHGVPRTSVMVRFKPSPNDRLEKEYGVTAAELVRKVRAGEAWIDGVESFQVQAKDQWTRTAEGIAHQKKRVREDFPDADLTRERFWGLAPEQKGEIGIAFDRTHFRAYDFAYDKSESLRLWTGREFISYEKYFTHDQEQYSIWKDLPDFDCIFQPFMWPRAAQHRFWWNTQQETDWEGECGRPEEFILVGKEQYHGVSCYVLECYPKFLRRVRRWFVGVADGLRYGDLIYEKGQLFQENWTEAYKETSPGCWFPTRQGYHMFQRHPDGTYFVAGARHIQVERVEVNHSLSYGLFAMDYKEGVRVTDNRFGGLVSYRYKRDRTDEEWNQIYQKARERQEADEAEKKALDSRIGQVAMEFPSECQWVHSEPLTLQELRGKAVVLQFWGIWCGPCHDYMGFMKSPEEDADVVFIGVHTPADDLSAIEADMDKYKADGPVCADIGQGWGTINEWHHVRSRPYWIVIGPDGKVAGHSDQPSEAFKVARESLEANDE